jgi:DNA-directed RNA polymerase omega subunit
VTHRRDPRGITHPSVDDLTAVTGSQYQLVNVAARRARQITAFHGMLDEGLLRYNGPMVKPRHGEKPLTTALREISEQLVEVGRVG